MTYSKSKLLFNSVLTIALYIVGPSAVLAQTENIKIVPLSPNAAEMTRYGEIPVSNFTGVPNINIPVYRVQSGSLEIPLSLSYHAGGNKVESIASWVGLSWSLSGLPSISRSVNGQPDEGTNGFFYPYQKTVRGYFQNYMGGHDAQLEDFLAHVRDDKFDTEADFFSFNVNGKSGRFIFNQDANQFFTTPYSNVKISYANNGFTLISDDGTKYIFGEREITTVNGTNVGTPVTTSWMISQIISANTRDTITFNYTIENQLTQSLSSQVKNLFLSGGQGCVQTPPVDAITEGQLTTINGKLLSSIVFKGGQVTFTKQNTEREDLAGGYALDYISVLDKSNSLVKRFKFNYKYLTGTGGGSGCLSNNFKSGKWMLLTNFSEQSTNLSASMSHSFEYNEAYVPPCRNSPAQDYWGYYNGATGNANLIPTTVIPNSNNFIVSGADRHVNPLYSQFAILKKISYPTGGYTLFEYENNDSNEKDLPKVYATEHPYVAEEGFLEDGEQLPNVKDYETTFIINNPPDYYLNGFHTDGGAYVSADVQNLGVPYGSVGATVLIQRISPSSPTVNVFTSGSFINYYFPNGTYKLKASFNQNPPNYQNFWAILTYNRVDSAYTNKYIGGLRIKKVENYTASNSVPLTKKYFYVDTLGSNVSSGASFLGGRFNFTYTIPVGSMGCPLTRIRSYSNQSQVTFSGSYVGYKKVFVQTEAPMQTGLSSYTYTTVKDQLFDDHWPFPPPQSMEAFRGQLLNSSDYKFHNNSYKIVKRTSMQYIDSLLASNRIYTYKSNTEQLEFDGNVGNPKGYGYELALEWSALSRQTERIYNVDDSTKYVQSVTDFHYDEPYKQLISKTSLNSKGQSVKVKNYFSYNLALSGTAESARLWLLSHNNIAAVLKEETTVNNVLSNVKITNYKSFDGQDLVMDHEFISYPQSVNDKRTVLKDLYDNYGNLLQHRLEDGMTNSYLWGYGGVYPVIAVQNASYQSLLNILGSTVIANLNIANPNKSIIDAVAATLRSNLPNAQVTTYTYSPLVGMTSSTDAKGETTYYEYDSFQRLKNVKDSKGHIIKQTDYHYQNQ